MGFYISSLSRAACSKAHLDSQSSPRHYQVAPSYNYRWTDLHYEASRGNMEKLQQLLVTSDRELVDRKDYYGKTPLYWAAYKGQKLSMELLLQHGASVNTCCKHGGTPLHAAIGLFPDCTLLLIQHGADVNLQDNWGVTPMYLAACSGQIECIRLLVQAGPDITYKNKKTGATPKRLVSQTALISWIESCCRQPRSLKHLSRLRIRTTLGHQRLEAIRGFDLPTPLKRYLMYEDLVLQDGL
ncbi:poly [ADP-ribose] polymerase tankyrase-2-like isoform X1 [Trachemys scripta elegans]|uniref:poly [ADP-ribose] polymerase tankyrase-2-like isoform X1 n=1 Tax=Trachemys scripta elegans TaxID=31138 RepID=UPI001556E807|nr:poly [ADP-ribose] polymerase tankyrase-2-like isoform X1 [Trachemys scripta elegans]XP_034632596.1 poly [ADP-ribose] polymerase tankyrase-2-like isoform X1 [Trachemys scripta elegans]